MNEGLVGKKSDLRMTRESGARGSTFQSTGNVVFERGSGGSLTKVKSGGVLGRNLIL